MYDAIIVGARCAGSPLAMQLARQGARVLLLDRAEFPSDIPHGHFIHRDGPRRLRQWGLLDRVADTAPAVTDAIYDAGDFPLAINDLVEDGLPWAYAPRRTTLDKLLADAAVESGAELRERFNVDEYVFEDGVLAGVRGRGPDGKQVEERARITIGADGRNSRLARTVQAPVYKYVPPLLFYYFSYWRDLPIAGFELYSRLQERRLVIAFSTEGGLTGVFVGAPMQELPAFRRDIEASFLAATDGVPGFGERLRSATRVERFYGASDLPTFYRKPYGPGWALAGDAGYHKDPYLALGISDAFRDADLLAAAIAQAWSGELPVEEAMAGYERLRNEATRQDYDENLAAASFAPLPPQVLGLRAVLRHNPQEATRMFKARVGMIDPASFFNPENLQRLMSQPVAP